MKSWDVIVIGSGAGGFAAAVTACCKGLSVLMLEKAPQFGGTSAISGGAVWINDTDQARAQGKSGAADAIKTYLKTIVGEQKLSSGHRRCVCRFRARGAGVPRKRGRGEVQSALPLTGLLS